MATLGILCGMEAEAAALGALRYHQRVIVSVTGGLPERVDRAVDRFLRAGCIRMLSWGVCGGLDPRLAPGTVLVPDMVETAEGERIPLARHAGLGREAAASAPAVLLLGLDTPVLTAEDRDAVFHASGAAAVDMETHRLARFGAEYSVDTMAVRVIADPAGCDVPEYLAGALDETGRPRIGVVLGGLARRPGTLPVLLRLARHRQTALGQLRRIATTGLFDRLLA